MNKLMVKRKIIFVIIILLLMSGCNKSEKKRLNQYDFIEKCAYSESGDWVYSFCITYNKDKNGNFDLISNYHFNGYDLIGKVDDDTFSIITVDKTSGEIVDSTKAPYNSLLTGSKTRDEIYKIDKYFNSSSFSKENVINDLYMLNLKYIKPDLIYKLYKEALSKKERELGFYTDIPVISTINSEIEGGELRLGYLISYGYIDYIKIDFIDSNGRFLSDLVSEGKATEEQINDYINLITLQDFILEKQRFEIDESIEWKYFKKSDLIKLLELVVD